MNRQNAYFCAVVSNLIYAQLINYKSSYIDVPGVDAQGLVIDSDSHFAYVSGSVNSTGVCGQQAYGLFDAILVKYDLRNNNVSWCRQYGGSRQENDGLMSDGNSKGIALTDDGFVALNLGYTSNDIQGLTLKGALDTAVVLYHTNGSFSSYMSNVSSRHVQFCTDLIYSQQLHSLLFTQNVLFNFFEVIQVWTNGSIQLIYSSDVRYVAAPRSLALSETHVYVSGECYGPLFGEHTSGSYGFAARLSLANLSEVVGFQLGTGSNNGQFYSMAYSGTRDSLFITGQIGGAIVGYPAQSGEAEGNVILVEWLQSNLSIRMLNRFGPQYSVVGSNAIQFQDTGVLLVGGYIRRLDVGGTTNYDALLIEYFANFSVKGTFEFSTSANDYVSKIVYPYLLISCSGQSNPMLGTGVFSPLILELQDGITVSSFSPTTTPNSPNSISMINFRDSHGTLSDVSISTVQENVLSMVDLGIMSRFRSFAISSTTLDAGVSFQLPSNQLSIVVIVLIVVFVLFIVNLALLYCYCLYSKRHKAQVSRGLQGTSMTSLSRDSGFTQSITTTDIFTTAIVTSHELSLPGYLKVAIGLDYILGDALNKGATGTIVEAKVISFNLRNRAKGLPIIAKLSNASLASMNEQTAVCFKQEVALQWRFRDNKNFAKVYGWSDTPHATILMQYYALGALSNYIKQPTGLLLQYHYSKRQIFCIFTKLCNALLFLHQCGVAHCDVKPDNVLLDVDRILNCLVPVLSDFGISKVLDTQSLHVQSFQVSKVKGFSRSYAAPEVIQRTRSHSYENDPEIWLRGDIYATAILLVEMLKRAAAWSLR